ncbi:MAG: hypothetical protein IPO66_04070 [Rhodanobacteraceae bacterium]|nr:hypothetical protein [Rhodanobacteraceae bacterium]
MSDVTELIQRAAVGDRAAFDAAYQHIHAELKSLAVRRLNADHNRTLSATMLVNETWLKLAGSVVNAENRAHFFRIAAQAMRQIWIDRQRSRAAELERIRLYVGAAETPVSSQRLPRTGPNWSTGTTPCACWSRPTRNWLNWLSCACFPGSTWRKSPRSRAYPSAPSSAVGAARGRSC